MHEIHKGLMDDFIYLIAERFSPFWMKEGEVSIEISCAQQVLRYITKALRSFEFSRNVHVLVSRNERFYVKRAAHRHQLSNKIWRSKRTAIFASAEKRMRSGLVLCSPF